MGQVTIREIATSAGVSAATVSLALRKSPKLAAHTREHVFKVAEKLGWKPNPMVSAWMAHRRMADVRPRGERIAYLMCLPDRKFWGKTPSFTRFLDGARARARAYGYEIEEHWLCQPGMTHRRMSDLLIARGIDGVILGSAPTAHARVALQWNRFAMAAQGFSVVVPEVSRVACNYSQAVGMAIHELRKLGYQRIGFCIPPKLDARCRRLWSATYLGYQQLIAEAFRVPLLFCEGDESRKLEQWLEVQRPEAVITFHTHFIGLIQKLGLRVPQDIGIVCPDLHPNRPETNPDHLNCAGIDQNLENGGAAAVDLVVQQLYANQRGCPAVPLVVFTPVRWVSGDTVQPSRKIAPALRLPRTTCLPTDDLTAALYRS